MDVLDAALLTRLEEDYRVPSTHLAKALGVTRATVRRRVRTLFHAGHFGGYQVEVSRLALGFERLVYLEVKTNPRESWLPKALESLDQCVQSAGVIGEYGLVFKMAFRGTRELSDGLKSFDDLIARSESKRYRLVDTIETHKERGFAPTRVPRQEIDSIDQSILGILANQKSPSPVPLWRLSNLLRKEAGRGVSRSTIQKRITALEHRGVITQFTLQPRRWSRVPGIRAFMRIKADPGRVGPITEAFVRLPEVLCLYRTGEEYSLFCEIFVSNLSSLNSFLKRIYEIEGVVDSSTTIVVEVRKEVGLPRSAFLPMAGTVKGRTAPDSGLRR